MGGNRGRCCCRGLLLGGRGCDGEVGLAGDIGEGPGLGAWGGPGGSQDCWVTWVTRGGESVDDGRGPKASGDAAAGRRGNSEALMRGGGGRCRRWWVLLLLVWASEVKRGERPVTWGAGRGFPATWDGAAADFFLCCIASREANTFRLYEREDRTVTAKADRRITSSKCMFRMD